MTEEINSKSKSFLMGCGIAALIPVLLLILTAVIFTVNNRPPKIAIPSHSVPKDNGWDNFVLAGKMVSRTGHALALVEFRKGLSKSCVHPCVRKLLGSSGFLEYYSGFRGLGYALSDEATYYAMKGQYGRATESQLDCIELGVSIANKGPIITDMVGHAIVLIGSKNIKGNLSKLTPEELARAAKHLERIQKDAVPYSEVILEESYVTAAQNVDIFTKPECRRAISKPGYWATCASHVDTGSGAAKFIQGIKFALTNKSAAIKSYLAYSKALAAEAKKPYTGKSNVPVPGNLIAELEGQNALRSRLPHLDYEANILLIQTEIALRRYNADNGRYPAKLDQLVPKYLKSVPIDPFGIGKPLRYSAPLKIGKSFKLYSLGFNLIDDGGKPPIDKYDRESGDIVLGQEY
ncbi:MAG: hypothetical protein NT018_09850 [Armatimonadetes bacterium]|nr:hypothetical protein [Armatimonadota bacterium]